MSNVKELNLHKTLPTYLRQDAFAVAFVKAVDEELQQIADEIKLVRLLENIELQSDSTLDHLAKHFHVDFYDSTLRREQKINLIRNSYQAHLYKGTPYAVRLALDSLNLDGEIEEWFQYDGEPFTFKVKLELSDVGITEDTINMLERLIGAYKNKRSHLINIQLAMRSVVPVNLFSTSIGGERLKTLPEIKTNAKVRGLSFLGTNMQTAERVVTAPEQVKNIKGNSFIKAFSVGQVTEIQTVRPPDKQNVITQTYRKFVAGTQVTEYIVGGK